MTLRRVLVTGARGFIGRHTLAPLIERGYETHAVSSRKQVPGACEVTWHCADLLDAAQVTELLDRVRPSHLLHFAWFTKPGEFWSSAENFTWVGAGLALAHAFTLFGGERVVAAGSCAEYDWHSGLCDESATPLVPRTPYGVCKNAFRQLLESFAGLSDMSMAWGRIFFVYGPHEPPGRLVSSVVGSLLNGMPALCTEGDQLRDYLYVADAAEAFVSLLDSDVQGPVNIASGHAVMLREMVLDAADLLGRRELVRFGAVPPSLPEPAKMVASVERLATEVGWAPRYSWEHGLNDTVEYWKCRVAGSRVVT